MNTHLYERIDISMRKLLHTWLLVKPLFTASTSFSLSLGYLIKTKVYKKKYETTSRLLRLHSYIHCKSVIYKKDKIREDKYKRYYKQLTGAESFGTSKPSKLKQIFQEGPSEASRFAIHSSSIAYLSVMPSS